MLTLLLLDAPQIAPKRRSPAPPTQGMPTNVKISSHQLEMPRIVRNAPTATPTHTQALTQRTQPVPDPPRHRVPAHSVDVDIEGSPYEVL